MSYKEPPSITAWRKQADFDFCVVFFMLFYAPIIVAGLLAYLASQGYFK